MAADLPERDPATSYMGANYRKPPENDNSPSPAVGDGDYSDPNEPED